MREVATEVAAFNAVNAEVQIRANPKQAFEKIAEVDAALRLISGRDVKVDVKVDIDKARARIRILKAELEHALSGGAGARPIQSILDDVGVVGAQVAKIGTDLTSLGEKAGAAFAQIGSSIGAGLESGLQTASSGLATVGVTAGIVVVVATALLPIIIGLAGVFGALAASLAAAAAGFGALLTGGLFALAPVVGVAIFAVTRLIGAVKALQLQNKQSLQVTKDLRAAEQAHTQAIKTKQDATENLARATVDAKNAERDAILGVKDAILQEQAADLGIQDAALGLERAKLKLKEIEAAAKSAGPAFGDLLKKFKNVDLNTDPKQIQKLIDQVGGLPGGNQHQLDAKQALLDVAHAQLQVKESKLQDTKATNTLTDAVAKNNDFTKRGLLAYQPYAAALNQVAAANKSLADSTQHTADIRAKAAQTTSKFTAAELAAGKAAIALFDDIKKALAPVTGPVFGGLLKLLDGLDRTVSNPRIHAGLEGIGRAIASILIGFGHLLGSREVVSIFTDLEHAGAGLAKVIGGRIFQDLFLIFLRIARQAAPPLVELFGKFADFLDGLRKGTDNAGKLRRGVKSVVDSLTTWLELAHQLGRVILSFFRGAKTQGDGLVQTITRLFKRWADFLGTKAGQQAVHDFLVNAISETKKFLHFLDGVIGFFNAVQPLAKVVLGIVSELAKVIGISIQGFTELNDLVHPGNVDSQNRTKANSELNNSVKALRNPKLPESARAEILSNAKATFEDELGKKAGDAAFKRWVAKNGFRNGGLVPGFGGHGDDQIRPLEGGEFVLRRAVVAGIGLPALTALNNGSSIRAAGASAAGGGGITIEKQDVILPAAPGHDQMGDPKSQAAEFAKELRRRGRGRGV